MGGDIEMHSNPGEGSKFTLQLTFEYASATDAGVPDKAATAKALIFGTDNYCLMEARTLFDRAGVSTESSLIDNSEGVEPVRQCIQRNLAYVDLLVFDLRHLDIDLGNVLDREMTAAARIILLHYDQIIELPPILQQAEFFSVINTSQENFPATCKRDAANIGN